MRSFSGTPWRTALLVPSGLWTLWGIMSQAHDLWTAGLSPTTWTAIGALWFIVTVIVLVARLELRASASAREPKPGISPVLFSPNPAAIPTKKVFQELRSAAGSTEGADLLVSPSTVDDSTELPPEQIKILQLLANSLDLVGAGGDVPIETVAEVTGIRPSVLLHHIEQLDDRDFIYKTHDASGPHVRLVSKGSGWLIDHKLLPK
jgi:hypothetical protein